MSKLDCDCREFADILSNKKPHYPISDRYITNIHDSPVKSGRNEREHMVSWFEDNETTGSGSYTRRVPNASARRCYNMLQNVASLLWIAEAAGISSAIVERAYDEAVKAGDRRRACGAIRRLIPWEEVCTRLQG